jgi:pilus assembly protein Flp/PilA
MRFITDTLTRLMSWMREEAGQTLVEYAIILALISVAAIAVLVVLGPQVADTFNEVSSNFPVVGG